eukprot:964459-Alexandrium_andersonii.AAC.1
MPTSRAGLHRAIANVALLPCSRFALEGEDTPACHTTGGACCGWGGSTLWAGRVQAVPSLRA